MKNKRFYIKKLIWLLFIIYISGLIYFLLFAERYGRQSLDTYRYNIVPFSEIKRYICYIDSIGIELFLINIVGNVVAFIPFGASLPLINKKYKSFISILLIGLLFILSIETIQLVMQAGSFDVDDIILDSTGVVIGFVISKILRFIYNKRNKD